MSVIIHIAVTCPACEQILLQIADRRSIPGPFVRGIGLCDKCGHIFHYDGETGPRHMTRNELERMRGLPWSESIREAQTKIVGRLIG